MVSNVLLFVTLFSLSSAFAGVKPITEVFEPDASNFPAEKWVKVAAVSYNPAQDAPIDVPEAEVTAYKARVQQDVTERVREAAKNGAEVVVTPEFGLVGYPDIPELPSEEDEFRNREDIKPYLETVPGPSTKHFGALTKELGIWLVIGLAEKDGAKNYNTTVVLNPKGQIVTKYRKINLYEGETNFLDAGQDAVTFDSDLFGRAALMICSDIYSGFPASALAKKKPDVTLFSTSWAQYNTGWSNFVAYASGSATYLVAANQNYFPDTGVINPDGTAQSHIRQTRGTAYGYVPRKSAK